MTQKEIIQAISDDKMMPFIQPEQLAEIVNFVIENYKPSLPSNLDEAANSYSSKTECAVVACRGFKAGAEWMAGQGVKAYCIESSNPISDNPNTRLHCITLLYEENENMPYVLACDEVEIILRKK